MKQLNDRQIALYHYLESRGDQWTLQKDVANDLTWYYPLFENEAFHDSKARFIMTADIQEINDNEEIKKIIISGRRGIKLANEAEFSRYIKSQYKSVFRKLKRIRIKEKKGRMNGQMLLLSKEELIEAFLQEN